MSNIKKVKNSKIQWDLSDYDVLNAIMYRTYEKIIDIKEISQLKEYTNPDVFLCRYYGYTRANPIIIQKFTIKLTDIKRKCPLSCRWFINHSNKEQCMGHEADDFIKNIQNHVKKLNEIRYRTLVPYEFVLCKKKSNHINVYLVQNFQEIYQVYYRLHGSIDCFKIIIYDILQTVEFLHRNGLTHNCLDLKYCGLNNSSDCVQFFEYSITPFLRDILSEYSARDDDLQSLGKLSEELWLYMPDTNSISESSQNKQPGIDMPDDLKDFIKKCKFNPQSSVQDLLTHPFLQRDQIISMDKNKLLKTNIKSNLTNDFEILQVLGKGAYGIVLKVKNYFDSNLYAVKRILLQSYEQLYKKSREIELLSILMHENVVRYYNCWIEDASLDSTDEYELDISLLSICSSAEPSRQRLSLKNLMNISASKLNTINSYSNSIEFKYEPDDVRELLSNENQKINSNKGICKIINIQMEFCEKSTLRKAIDDNLHQDSNRSFRLLCQIVTGLSYIHGKDIIHRDLKPDNIFLNEMDQIKIGDFGQATCVASKVMMMNYDLTNIQTTQVGTASNAVGTSLYVAPEIMENLPKSVYDYRVDLYSLGIIYYEMCNPPFKTSMERYKKIQELRDGKLNLPDSDNNKIIKALIQKDPDLRKVSLKTFSCNLKIT